MTDDLLSRARAFLVQCGSCDFGLMEFGCSCPPGDPRAVISDLVTEIERLTMPAAMPVSIAQDGDETLLFFFTTEKGRDGYAAAPDRNTLILEVGDLDDVPGWTSGSPYWVRALTAGGAE